MKNTGKRKSNVVPSIIAVMTMVILYKDFNHILNSPLETPELNLNLGEVIDLGAQQSLEVANGGVHEPPDMVPGAKCANFEDRLDKLVASSKSVFITMPAKAAGTSLKKFTFECVGRYSYQDTKDGKKKHTNFVNKGNDKVKFFTANVVHPKILTSHTYTDYGVVDVLQNTPRDNLNVYIYREETDRLLSALREVVVQSVCTKNQYPKIKAKRTGDKCIISETVLVDSVLKKKKAEVGFGNNQIMTCDFYKAIEDNFPRMVFLHYSKADKLQQVLAKHHCPNLTDKFFHNNMSSQKTKRTFVRLESDNSTMPFNDWLEAKRHTIEWTFGYNEGSKCRGKTRKLEDKLLSCKDQMLEVTNDVLFA